MKPPQTRGRQDNLTLFRWGAKSAKVAKPASVTVAVSCNHN